MSYNLEIDGFAVPSGLQRVIKVGTTGLSSGSVSVPDFDTSGNSYIISTPAGYSSSSLQEYSINSYSAVFSFNNSTKMLSWSFPSITVNSSISYVDPGLSPAAINTKYILVQEGGPVTSSNSSGIKISDPSGSLDVDDSYPTLSVISTRSTALPVSGTPVRFSTDTYSTITYYYNSARARQFDADEWSDVTYDDSVTIPFAAATTNSGIRVAANPKAQHIGALLMSPLTTGSYPLTWGMASLYNTGQRPIPSSGMALYDETGQAVYTSSDTSIRLIAQHDVSNILNLNVNSYVDITHESTSSPFYYVSNTFNRLFKWKTNGNNQQRLLCRPSLMKLSNTTSRLLWSPYCTMVTSASGGFSGGNDNVANVSGTVGLSAIIGVIE